MRKVTWIHVPTKRQVEAHVCPSPIIGYGGAMGGGKTRWAVAEAIQRGIETPGNRIALGRKTLTSLRQTTFVTFLDVCPPEIIRQVNQATMQVTFHNRSEFIWLPIDVSKDPLLEGIKSLEVSTIVLEEATQLTRKALEIAVTRTRYQPRGGHHPRRGVLLTCNPEVGWVKETFYDPWAAGKLDPRVMAFIQALPGDNPHLPAGYLDLMQQILTPEDQLRYLDGLWTAPVDPARLIGFEFIKASLDGDWLSPLEVVAQVLAVDVAYEGDDMSCIWLLRFAADGRWDARRVAVLKGCDEEEVADEACRQWMATGTRASLVVDAVGVGSGVATILRRRGVPRVLRFKGGERPAFDGLQIRYRNLRDQAWWWARIYLAAGQGTMEEVPRAVEDLSSIRYKVTDRQIQVERKVELKKRIGRSPDDGDAIVMGLWAHRFGGGMRATGRSGARKRA